MFAECLIRGRRFAPARFSAPLAGYTHSAFRRLLAEWGGCGAVWTEMLAARQILAEDFQASPWLRRRPGERNLFYQLMARVGDPLDRILGRLADHGAEAIDLNLACDAHTIRACEAGSALFADFAALCRVVTEARRCWPGLLTVKLRLGRRAVDWQARFAERLRLFAETGLDAVIVHPRFFEDKFRRRAQHELIPWIASLTALPLIVNGDLAGPAHVAALAEPMRAAAGIMIGRMALVRPWLFAAWDRPFVVDHAAVWHRLCDYISEDFPPETALRRVKMFTKYFAANFAFGHSFAVCVANAATLPEAVRRADDFFARSPQLVAQPTVAGI